MKNLLLIIAVTALTLSLFAVLVNSEGSLNAPSAHPELIPAIEYKGNLTIYANGTVSNAAVIGQSGNTYLLQKDVLGNITDLRNDSILAGNGFSTNATAAGVAIKILNASGVTLTGLNVINSYVGAKLFNSSSITIENSNFTAKSTGISSYDSPGLDFNNLNVSAGTGTGIALISSPTLNLVSSKINASTGVNLANSTYSAVFSEDYFVIYVSGHGLSVAGDSSNIVFAHSVISSTKAHAGTGISISSDVANNVSIQGDRFLNLSGGISLNPGLGTNYAVDNNTFSNEYYPIYFGDVENFVIKGNMVNGSKSNAIVADYPYNGTISYNTITNFSAGYDAIYADYSIAGLVISHNTIFNPVLAANTEGISVFGGSPVTVFDNTVSKAQFAADIEFSMDVSVFDNTFFNCTYGLYTTNDQQYRVFSNNIMNSNYSISSNSDQLGQYYSNTVTNDTEYMLEIDLSSYLTFYHNNFMNGSKISTLLKGIVSVKWNLSLPIGGNYWSNYTGPSSNGIGSVPQNVTPSGSFKDFLPLAAAWTGYTIAFTESGLPTGSLWSVTLGSSTLSSTGSTIVFSPAAAEKISEPYTVGSVPGYNATSSGTVSLDGSSHVITITFTAINYTITFSETGLPAGSSWSVTINGLSKTSKNATISFSEPDGTYNVNVTSPSGYNVSLQSKTVTVNNGNANFSATFKQQSVSTPSGNPVAIYEGIGIGAAVGLVVGVLGTMYYNGTWIFRTDRKKKG